MKLEMEIIHFDVRFHFSVSDSNFEITSFLAGGLTCRKISDEFSFPFSIILKKQLPYILTCCYSADSDHKASCSRDAKPAAGCNPRNPCGSTSDFFGFTTVLPFKENGNHVS